MYDVCIIGAGPGGYVAAIRAAQLGLKVCCIEKRKTFGGTCLNVGCIPSKALLYSSEQFAFIKNEAKEHGIVAKDLKVDLAKMMQRKDQVVKGLCTGVEMLFRKNRIEAIQGVARFKSPTELEVNGKIIEAKNFILASGSESVELKNLPFDEKTILSSTGALSLSKIPKKLIVIGAGVIGVELASVYNNLGSDVTIVEMLDHIVPGIDREISKHFQQILQSQGLKFHLSAKVKEVKNKSDLIVQTTEEKIKLSADCILVAIGRRPYSENLGLGKLGIEKTDRGHLIINQDFQTKYPHIYAIGDLIEGPMLAHRASEEGIAVAEIIAGHSPNINYMAIPNVIYTNPELASVGLSEEEAKNLNIVKATFPFKANSRARCTDNDSGLVKILAEEKTKKILGLHILGPNASEMIGEGALAIEKHATLDDIANLSHAHPTYSEAIKEAALKALGRVIHM